MLMLLSGCFGIGRIPELNAFCSGLEAPIDRLANAILDNSSNTPSDVVLAGTTVVVAYDGGCKENT